MTMNATFKRPSMALEMEFGSLKELAGYIQEEGTALATIFGDDMELVVKALSGGGEPEAASGGEAEQPATKGRRGRPVKAANGPDPATAAAPAPLPIPPAAAPPTAPDTAPGANGIPAFLDRTAAPPAPPVAPPPPPPAPVTPPSGILAGKVIANLDTRKATTADEGKSLVDWLAASGIVNAGSSYDESIAAIRLMGDDKLAGVAVALEVK